MAVNSYYGNVKLSKHFNFYEFKCPHCGKVKISDKLISELERIFDKVHASKCIISSGYRCPTYDKKENGFTGRHSEGLACDCCYYDKNGKIIPSKIICCVAWDLGIKGIAYIDKNYVHLDVRENGTYYGDERYGNSSYWTNPYEYFGVSKDDVRYYTNEGIIKYQVHGLNKKWYSNVRVNDNQYAGVFGVSIDGVYIDDLIYRVRVNGKWLPPVVGRSDYAGIIGKPITDIAIKGNVKYRVHLKNSNRWLGYVSGYDINDYKNGYAGNGNLVDAIEIRYK